jgi:hypothetical protein
MPVDIVYKPLQTAHAASKEIKNTHVGPKYKAIFPSPPPKDIISKDIIQRVALTPAVA